MFRNNCRGRKVKNPLHADVCVRAVIWNAVREGAACLLFWSCRRRCDQLVRHERKMCKRNPAGRRDTTQLSVGTESCDNKRVGLQAAHAKLRARSACRHLVVPQPHHLAPVMLGRRVQKSSRLAAAALRGGIIEGSACRRSKYERDGISRFHADFRKRGCSPPTSHRRSNGRW